MWLLFQLVKGGGGERSWEKINLQLYDNEILPPLCQPLSRRLLLPVTWRKNRNDQLRRYNGKHSP